MGGMQLVGIPSLEADQVIVYDSTMVRLVVRADFAFEVSDQAEFKSDLFDGPRKGRFSVSAPVPAKSLRQFSITAPRAAAEQSPAARRRGSFGARRLAADVGL